MPNPISIRELKGAPLSIVVLLFQPEFRGTNVTMKVLMRETGFGKDTLEKGLDLLVSRGYIHRIGEIGQGGADLWGLAADCPSFFPAPIEQLPAPELEPTSAATNVTPVVTVDSDSSPVSDPESATLAKISPALRSSSSLTTEVKNQTNKLLQPTTATLSKKSPALQATPLPEPPPPADSDPSQHLVVLLADLFGASERQARSALAQAFQNGGTAATIEAGILEWAEYRAIDTSDTVRNWAALVCARVRERLRPSVLPNFSSNWQPTDRQRRILELRGEEWIGDYYTRVVEAQQAAPDESPEPEPTPPPPPPAPPDPLWQTALAQLELEMPKHTFETWVRFTTLAARTDTTITIGVPNAYAKDWLENRLRGAIKRTLGNLLGHTTEVEFTLQD